MKGPRSEISHGVLRSWAVGACDVRISHMVSGVPSIVSFTSL